ncbi:tetratricopeptide repeat protein [Brachybacterium paraconglomeratum]|uniref:tetratricopeptide repeat protein n=1 Tax=Brachybacterium paraconglomeratum TaxID=173362 RepID=UPI003510FD80
MNDFYPSKMMLGDPPGLASPWIPRSQLPALLRSLSWENGGEQVAQAVIVGQAGSGKTQLAAAVFRQLADEADLALWVSHDRQNLVEAYAEAESKIHSTEVRDGGVDVDLIESSEEVARRFVSRLRDRATWPYRWVIVIDNVSNSRGVLEDWLWPPLAPHGRTLLTTQTTLKVNSSACTLWHLGPLEQQEVRAFLNDALPRDSSSEERSIIGHLAGMVGGHPLSLQMIHTLLRESRLEPSKVLSKIVSPSRHAEELMSSGRYLEATHQLRQLVDTQSSELPITHPTVLATKANLATALAGIGHFDEARDLLAALVFRMSEALGSEHPTTLTTRANLARLHGQVGDLPRAIEELSSLVADLERVLGPDHPTTLTTRANLAQVRGQAGELAGAIAELSRLVSDQERVLGADHPTVLAARANLAQMHGETGDALRALAELRDLVADQNRVLGADHPTTLTTRANLAQTYGQAGNAPRALADLRELLRDQERVMGQDHPMVLATHHKIAFWLNSLGRHAEALAALERAIPERVGEAAEMNSFTADHVHRSAT